MELLLLKVSVYMYIKFSSQESVIIFFTIILAEDPVVEHVAIYQLEVDKNIINNRCSEFETDISKFSPSSEQSGGLWVVCVFI